LSLTAIQHMVVGWMCEKVMHEIYVMYSQSFKPVQNREVKNVSVLTK